MKNATRYGIYYNLDETQHICRFAYAQPGGIQLITFCFSSAFYRTLFLQKANENRERVKDSFRKKFSVQLNGFLLADLQLYQRVEKRGFRLEFTENGKTAVIRSVDEMALYVKGAEKYETEANKMDSCGQCDIKE